jgi:hypothetical protein
MMDRTVLHNSVSALEHEKKKETTTTIYHSQSSWHRYGISHTPTWRYISFGPCLSIITVIILSQVISSSHTALSFLRESPSSSEANLDQSQGAYRVRSHTADRMNCPPWSKAPQSVSKRAFVDWPFPPTRLSLIHSPPGSYTYIYIYIYTSASYVPSPHGPWSLRWR